MSRLPWICLCVAAWVGPATLGPAILGPATLVAQDLEPVKPPADAPKLSEEMSQLFKAMTDSAADSQKVFQPLSVNQMNFRPSDGSHTPRWNAEHMAGRQLQFFSQLFHAQDPEIPVLDLNPKQMPDDYEFRHSDWTGQQEADWIKQVNDYCVRYSYLLADMDLDAKPPAGRWPSLRVLLKTMDKHYKEHTGNVVKKMKATDWPAE